MASGDGWYVLAILQFSPFETVQLICDPETVLRPYEREKNINALESPIRRQPLWPGSSPPARLRQCGLKAVYEMTTSSESTCLAAFICASP